MKKHTATAVEWLQEELNKRPKPIYNTEIDKLFAQAKAMEKYQMEDAYLAGRKYFNETNTDTP